MGENPPGAWRGWWCHTTPAQKLSLAPLSSVASRGGNSCVCPCAGRAGSHAETPRDRTPHLHTTAHPPGPAEGYEDSVWGLKATLSPEAGGREEKLPGPLGAAQKPQGHESPLPSISPAKTASQRPGPRGPTISPQALPIRPDLRWA